MDKPIPRGIFTLITIVTIFMIGLLQAQVVGDKIVEFGFEEGVDSEGAPLGVTMEDYNGNAVFTGDNVVLRSGTYSGSISGSDTLEVDAVYNVPFQLMQTGASYKVSMWMKTEMTEGATYVYLAWADVGFEAQAPTGSTDWTEYTAEFQYGGVSVDPNLNIELWGKGQVWIDDITVEKTAEVDLSLKNPGFEEPDATGEGPLGWFGHLEGGWTGRDENYVWDDSEAHSGTYSAKFQLYPQDSSNFYMAWRQDYPFIDNSLYKIGVWIKIDQPSTTGNCTFQLNLGHDNSNYADISPASDTAWVYVQDTILYGAVGENGWRNQMRFRFRGGSYGPDSLPTCWIDDVVLERLGAVPAAPQNVLATVNDANKVTITFDEDPNLQNPVYHILMQPTVYDTSKNQLLNGGFETPNDAGDGPEHWFPKSLGDDNGFDPHLTVWPAEDTDPYSGDFCIKVQSEDVNSVRGACVGWRIWGYDTPKSQRNAAYIYTIMTKYKNVIPRAGKIENIWGDTPDSIWASGVNLRNTWGDDAWFNTFTANENHPAAFGQDFSLAGTSDEWVEFKMPLSTHSGFGNGNFWGGPGLGNWPNMGVSGEAWFDEAGIYPFDEIATTSSGSYTIDNLPEGVEYIAVWAHEQGLPEKYGSSAVIAKVTSVTGIEDELYSPYEFALNQNYPNPFNPITQINYTLPKSELVTLTVYNVLGQRVVTLADNIMKKAGLHTITFNASKLASGLYFYKIEAGNNILTKKMMLVK